MTTNSTPARPVPSRKPRDDEIDAFGLTHVGKVRKDNQDHFLMASIHRRVQIMHTSLPDVHQIPLGDDRMAVIGMIADGVGGGPAGAKASATALSVAMEYVVSGMNCYYAADPSESDFVDALQNAAMRCHKEVLERAKEEPETYRMATTLTMLMAVFPWYYLLQVGDSRYYMHREGRLTQMTRDQTIAQDLVDQGVFTPAVAKRSSLSNVLSSAIGGESAMPRVTRIPFMWGTTHLLCSDGLTKHVSDEQIAARIRSMTSAQSLCEVLLQDALDGGGTDNVTIIAGRTVVRE
jgi:serine/threonine protein phosphatase PrpC